MIPSKNKIWPWNDRLENSPLCSQSQFICSSWESRKSGEKTPTDIDMSKGLTPSAGADSVRSNQSMLSMLLLSRFGPEGGVLSMRSSSIGDCNSSVSFSFCVLASSVLSNRFSSWVLEVNPVKVAEELRVEPGSWATWTKGGGRDSTVLIGRVVTLAVTGRGLSRPGGSCLMKGEISEKTNVTVNTSSGIPQPGQSLNTSNTSHRRFQSAHRRGHPCVGLLQWESAEKHTKGLHQKCKDQNSFIYFLKLPELQPACCASV